jgi:hypothetical protein
LFSSRRRSRRLLRRVNPFRRVLGEEAIDSVVSSKRQSKRWSRRGNPGAISSRKGSKRWSRRGNPRTGLGDDLLISSQEYNLRQEKRRS